MAINEIIEGYVSRQEAKERGLKFYFTGKPCKRGHIAERYTSNGKCIRCEKDYQVDYYADNKEAIAEQRKSYQAANKEAVAERRKTYLVVNKEAIAERHKTYLVVNKEAIAEYHKAYQANNKEAIAERHKTYLVVNKEAIAAWQKVYQKQRKQTDIQYWLAYNLRIRLCGAIKNNQKSGSAVRDLGCSVEFLKQHLERQFVEGMTWANRGKVWHIDHIEPLCSFDLEDREQLLIACHYTNLRPLFKEDNLKKIAEDKKKALLRKKNVVEPIFSVDGTWALPVD